MQAANNESSTLGGESAVRAGSERETSVQGESVVGNQRIIDEHDLLQDSEGEYPLAISIIRSFNSQY